MGNVFSLISNAPKVAFPDKKGYLRVQLYGTAGQVTRKVHRLVASHFIPNPHNLPQVNHMDGDKANNHATNLQWVTNRANMDHAIRNNLHMKHMHLVKLVPQIKTALMSGYRIKDIAANYHTTTTTIHTYLRRFDAPAVPISNLHVGRKCSYAYYDASRGKWRTDIRGFGLSNRQFASRIEAENYASRMLASRRRANGLR